MTRFANPKAMQNFTNQFGTAAAMGGSPRGNVNPKPQVGGTRPMGIGTPQIPPQNINPIRPGMKKGGKVSSASKRADGCAVKGKTKGKMV
jgi:hypothetical protein